MGVSLREILFTISNMETAKALAKAIKVMQVRGADLLTRLESAQREYAAAEKSGASKSMLVSYSASITKAESEYDSNHEAITSLQILEAAITRS